MMENVRWGALGFGATLALIVGLNVSVVSLAVTVGILLGMVAMLPLTGSLLLMLAACFPRRRPVVTGQASVAGPRALGRGEVEGGARPRGEEPGRQVPSPLLTVPPLAPAGRER